MLCKQCGAQITKKDKREDGVVECPVCGKRYRLKAASGTDKAPARRKAPRRRGPDKRLLIGGIALLLVIVLVLVLVLPAGEDRVAHEPIVTAEPTVEATAAPTPEPTATPEPIQPASVHFRAVGDIMSHKLQLRHYAQDGSYDPQFQYVKEALSSADYTIGNLETSISTNGEYSSWPMFRSPEALLATLKDCGVDMLTNSNNHILDGYWDGLVHTVNKVEEYGFDHIGAYRTPEEAAQPVIKDIKGIKFGFIAYTIYLNENEDCLTDEQAGFCVEMIQTADIEADVKALKDAGAEVIIALPHWGKEESRTVGGDTKEYARRMVESGVDIIIGTHSHMVQPITFERMEVNGEEKDILVAWSTGNFISYMAAKYMDSGIILDFTVNRDENGKISITDVGYVPVYVWGNTNRFHLICSGDFYSDQPDKMSDSDFKRMKQTVKEISGIIGENSNIEMLQH